MIQHTLFTHIAHDALNSMNKLQNSEQCIAQESDHDVTNDQYMVQVTQRSTVPINT